MSEAVTIGVAAVAAPTPDVASPGSPAVFMAQRLKPLETAATAHAFRWQWIDRDEQSRRRLPRPLTIGEPRRPPTAERRERRVEARRLPALPRVINRPVAQAGQPRGAFAADWPVLPGVERLPPARAFWHAVPTPRSCPLPFVSLAHTATRYLGGRPLQLTIIENSFESFLGFMKASLATIQARRLRRPMPMTAGLHRRLTATHAATRFTCRMPVLSRCRLSSVRTFPLPTISRGRVHSFRVAVSRRIDMLLKGIQTSLDHIKERLGPGAGPSSPAAVGATATGAVPASYPGREQPGKTTPPTGGHR